MPTLTDTGPLVALIDRGEAAHAVCAEALSRLSTPLVTTWPTVTEAMHILYRAGGWEAQRALLGLLEAGLVELLPPGEGSTQRITQLMDQYRDTPMSFADASLVVAAEERDLRTIFTLDGDFQVYRLPKKRRFRVIP